jgi:hypothetical protein
MRDRFEQQYSIGQRRIKDTPIKVKHKDKMEELIAGLKALYCHPEYNERLFEILERYLVKNKKKTGRPGMDLWCIFVLSQVRLCMNMDYGWVYNLANNHLSIRWLMGVETEYGFKRTEFSYQNIYDNVTLLSDEMIKEINSLVLEFGHGQVFKKKETAALRLKTDSFVVESNVHFPTDYNLLWDSARKCIETVCFFLGKYNNLTGWRKIKSWKSELKGLMRELGKATVSGGKGKEQREASAARSYINKAAALYAKLEKELPQLPIADDQDLALVISLEYFMQLLLKHIDLVTRRIINEETIPHEEKMFSIFETYTEWIKKGKSRPSVELGKKLAITTDQFDLIVDYQVMEHEQDRDIVIALADRLLAKYKIESWSFDKGYWGKENKQLLQLEVPKVIMPKLGKRNKQEETEETSRPFRRLKNKHSAIESNINELENRGLDRCPDRGYPHFKNYISLGICAYNLKKMGAKLLEEERERLRQDHFRKAA